MGKEKMFWEPNIKKPFHLKCPRCGNNKFNIFSDQYKVYRGVSKQVRVHDIVDCSKCGLRFVVPTKEVIKYVN